MAIRSIVKGATVASLSHAVGLLGAVIDCLEDVAFSLYPLWEDCSRAGRVGSMVRLEVRYPVVDCTFDGHKGRTPT